MKSTIVRFAFCLTALFTSTQAFAETGTLRVSVPFEFTVAGTKMPAGDYAIEETGAAGGTLIIQCLSAKRSVVVLSSPASVPSDSRGASLTFERVNGTRILTKVSTDSAIARSLPTTR